MTKKRLDLKYIGSDSKRRTTFKKRKSSLIKKIEEITTLCGIEACAIISTPDEVKPEVWPSHSGAKRVISKFREMPESEQYKKMLDQESFLTQRIQKAQEQLSKQRNDNRKLEMNILMNYCLSTGRVSGTLSLVDLNDLLWTIDQHQEEINRRLNGLEGQEGIANGEGIINEEVEAMQNQPWNVDNVIHGGEAHEMSPFGEVIDLPNGYGSDTFNP